MVFSLKIDSILEPRILKRLHMSSFVLKSTPVTLLVCCWSLSDLVGMIVFIPYFVTKFDVYQTADPIAFCLLESITSACEETIFIGKDELLRKVTFFDYEKLKRMTLSDDSGKK